MKETNTKLFNTPLETIYEVEFFQDRNKTVLKSNNLNEFEKEASNIFFIPINCKDNFSGNYDNYVKQALNHISSIKNLPFEKAFKEQNLLQYYPDKEKIYQILHSNKKLLLLDLDETLVHAEYPVEEKNMKKYDTILRFKSETESIDNINNNNEEYNEIGIYLRPGVRKFLSILNTYFNIAIFTAAEKDYTDAIIRYLDPNNDIFKFCLYRYNCINLNDLICIKDLRILGNINMNKTVLIDNNIYSFACQLNNGILINSFYGDENDVELFNVLSYLLDFILPSNDVREVNEKFFGFEKICQQLSE